jgi:hypothetical protein
MLSALAEATDSFERITQSTPAKQYQDTLDVIGNLTAPAIKSAATAGRVTMVVHRGMTGICRQSRALRKDPGSIAPTRAQNCKGELQVSSPAASLPYFFPTWRSALVRKFVRVSFPRRQSAPRELESV